MKEMLEEKLARYEELERMMTDPEILADGNQIANIAREQGSLVRVASAYRRFKDLNEEITQVREMIEGDDPEMKELAEGELPSLLAQREEVWEELLDISAAGDEGNRTKVMLEIRAGTGGDEAALFARDLFEMYKKYAETKGWKTEVMDASPTELGGFKEVVLGVSGDGSFASLQYESGGHRVQRVPETEAKGRVHTSAATVAVMAEPEDVEIDLKPDDYRKDIYHASGPGGQHVNKTASAIRLTHHETGIVVTCQDEKSQHKNLAKAVRVMKSRLYELRQSEAQQKRADERKSLVGSGDRSQRIRTYNFPENRITDHRINFTLYKLDQVLAGNLDPVTEALIEYDRQQIRDSVGALD
ncbi:Peptide chain release factor 1 [Planctomycetales bacterium 10988]|nr:Peptide chain release factor 1 [Planctomycetales bacterium 10988]